MDTYSIHLLTGTNEQKNVKPIGEQAYSAYNLVLLIRRLVLNIPEVLNHKDEEDT